MGSLLVLTSKIEYEFQITGFSYQNYSKLINKSSLVSIQIIDKNRGSYKVVKIIRSSFDPLE